MAGTFSNFSNSVGEISSELVNQARVQPGRKLQRILRLEDSSLWENFAAQQHISPFNSRLGKRKQNDEQT